jgi:AcrR family transcriptional regulator
VGIVAGRTPAPAGRTRWGTMSRERVIAAAVAAVTEDGYEQLTIRGLAASLGVAPMSLYRHVRDKEDLLDEVVDQLLATAWQPDTADTDVRGWIVEAADRLRRFLVAQPAALHVYLHRPVISPAAIARMDAMLDALEKITNDRPAAHRAYAAIQTYTVGFASLEASRAIGRTAEHAPAELVEQIAAYATPEQFVIGLGYLIDGIAAAQHTDRNNTALHQRRRRRGGVG